MPKVLVFLVSFYLCVTSLYAQKLFGGSFERQASQALAGQNYAYRFACTFYADEAGRNAMPEQLRFLIVEKRNNIPIREFIARRSPNADERTVANECVTRGATLEVKHYAVEYTYETIISPYEYNDSQGYYVVNDAPPVPRANTQNNNSPSLVLYHWFSPSYLFLQLDNADQGRAATGLSGQYAYMCRGEGKSLNLKLSVSPSIKYFDPQALDLTARNSSPLTDGALPFRTIDWKTGFNSTKPHGDEVYIIDSKPKFDNHSETTSFTAWTYAPQNGLYNIAFVTELRQNGVKLAENSLEMFAEVNDCKRTGNVALVVSDAKTNGPASNSFCKENPIKISSVTTDENLTYQWYKNDEAILGATNPTLTINETGNYYLKAQKIGACNEIRTTTVNAIALGCNSKTPTRILGNNIHDLVNTTGPTKNGFINNHSFRAIFYIPLEDLSKMPKSLKATLYRKRDKVKMEEITLDRNSWADLTHLLDRLCDNGSDTVQQVTYDGRLDFAPDVYNDQQGYFLVTDPICCRADADNIAQKGTNVVTYMEVGPANQVAANNTIQRGHTVDLNIPFTLQTCVGKPVRVFLYAGNRENITAQPAGFADLQTANVNGSDARQIVWGPGYSADNFNGNQNKFTIEPRRNGSMVLIGVPEKPGVFVYRIRIDGTQQNQVYSSVFQEFRLEVNDCTPPPTPRVFVSKVGKPNIPASTELCQDSLVQLNLKNFRNWAQLQWRLGKSAILNANDSILIVPRNQSGLYSCSIKMPRQCPEVITTAGLQINYLPKPTIKITAAKSALCLDEKIQLTNQSNATNGSYQWFYDNTPIGSTPSISAAKEGSYSVQVTDAKGCSNISEPFKIGLNPMPTAAFSFPNDYFCEGKSVQLNIPAKTGESYQWYKNNETIGINSPQLNVSQSGDYSLKVTNSLGCSTQSKPTTIKQLNNLSVQLVAPKTQFCPGGSLTISAQTNAESPKYQWLNNNLAIAEANNSSFVIDKDGLFSVSITDKNGCVGVSPVQRLATYPAPNLSISSPKNYLCVGGSMELTAAKLENHTYQWYRNDVAIGDSKLSLTVYDNANYTVKVTTPNGCHFMSAATKLQQMALPISSITTKENEFCEGKSLALNTQTTANNAVYQWFRDGKTIAGTSPQLTATEAGVYSVMVADSYGCSNKSNDKTLTINPLPKATITSPKGVICEGTFTTLLANQGDGLRYEWYQNGVLMDEKSVQIITGNTGIYTVKVTSAKNCTNNAAAVTLVQVKNPIVSIDAPVTRVCKDTKLAFNAVSNSAIAYQWILDGTAIDSTGTVLNIKQSGNYAVRATDKNGCEAISAAKRAEVIAPIVVKMDSLPDFCGYSFDPITLNGNPRNGDFSGKGISGNKFAPRVAGLGLHLLTYTVKGDLWCLSGTTTRAVVIKSAPQLNLGPDVNLYRGISMYLNADMGKGYTYQWNPFYYIDNQTTPKPKIAPDRTTTYIVRAVSPDNCASEDTITINVIQKLFMPDVFSPNGDGVNDTWKITGMEEYPDVKIQVWNRWGEMVYYADNNKKEAWDGTINGKPLTNGNYIYKIQYKPNGEIVTGSVMIMR